MPYLVYGEWGGTKTVEQGASTTVWAALNDEVKGGEYCVDCAVSPTGHPDAEDSSLAARLWDLTEEMIEKVEKHGMLPNWENLIECGIEESLVQSLIR